MVEIGEWSILNDEVFVAVVVATMVRGIVRIIIVSVRIIVEVVRVVVGVVAIVIGRIAVVIGGIADVG